MTDVLPFWLLAFGGGRSRRCCLLSDPLSFGVVASVLGRFAGASLSSGRSTVVFYHRGQVAAFVFLHRVLLLSRRPQALSATSQHT
ncbi:hypothetical protein MTO96_012195 [Rhipicephalus appendiculatus]